MAPADKRAADVRADTANCRRDRALARPRRQCLGDHGGVFLLVKNSVSPDLLRKALKLGFQAAGFVVGVLVGFYTLDALEAVGNWLPRIGS